MNTFCLIMMRNVWITSELAAHIHIGDIFLNMAYMQYNNKHFIYFHFELLH